MPSPSSIYLPPLLPPGSFMLGSDSRSLQSLIVACLTWGSSAGAAWADGPANVDFAHDVVPIVRVHCAQCHTDGTYKGSFSLDTRAAMIESETVVPGKPEASDLLARVTSHDPEERMPPPEKKPLSAREVELLRRWIAEGAAWQEGYSFKRNVRRAAPAAPRYASTGSAWPGTSHRPDSGRLLRQPPVDPPFGTGRCGAAAPAGSRFDRPAAGPR